jgi:transcriptional regulator with XRE-family HTH domain
MTFTEKLRRLTDDRVKQKISLRAGLPSTAISNYLSKGTIPNATTAVQIARALEVDPGWLIDDSKGWPPVRVRAREEELTAA